MNELPLVDIVLATYNGEFFLQEQLDSVVTQSYPNWRLLVRDDGSTDATMQILRDYAQRIGPRMVLLDDRTERLGACLNFGRVLYASTAPYIALCDQDDIWLPEKLARLLSAVRDAERRWGEDTPILVHSDLKVVDARGQVLADSFWRYQNLDPEASRNWRRQLVQNVVTGCATMFNRALRALALPISPQAIMHDWWLALLAACAGRVVPVAWASTLYRQHGCNDTGAKRWSLGYILARARRLPQDDSLVRTQRQAAALAQRLEGRVDEKTHSIIAAYGRLAEKGWLGRRAFVARHGLWKSGFVRNVGLLLRI
jgi:glycosyltransferase involved in cell wall biosynthesis